MIPNPKWFPTTLQERAAWYQNFITQFNNIGTNLGILPAEVTTLTNDSAVMTALADAAVSLEAYNRAVRQFRIYITEANIGDPDPEFPVAPTISVTGTPTGMFERLDGIVKRIRVAPAYTPEIGALLGIIPVSPARPPVNELKPVVTIIEAVDPYSFTMKATRFGLSAYKVQVQRSGSSNWVDNGFAQNNPHTVTISPTTAGQPERVLVRAVLMQNSEPVGIPSDPTYVTVNP